MAVRFTLNGRPRQTTGVAPSATVLDYLRDRMALKGTKEGCAEGDCGACTIVTAIADRAGGGVQAVNSCLMLVPQLDGKAVLTVEGLEREGGDLHPVQRSLLDSHGTQCGFCTPGIVMALYAYQHSGDPRDDSNIHESLAGNLCRCTGYRPIVEAALRLPDPAPPAPANGSPPTRSGGWSYECGGENFHAPASLAELLALRSEHPGAYLLGGGTDLGLLASKERRRFGEIIWTRRVPELGRIRISERELVVGAAATYTEALPAFDANLPALGGLVRRIGSPQIRNLGTLGGNVCTASPIGDTLPPLLALGSQMDVRSVRGRRRISAEEFFTGYRRTALADDEVLEAVRLPLPRRGEIFRTYKVAKRFDQDIAALIGAFAIAIENGEIRTARVAYGGMAATPARAPACEATLTGSPWSGETIEAAAAALERDFNPISDLRAGAAYRQRVAGNLLRRLYAELELAPATDLMDL
ncbi:MAG: xanthine dehydrogenase small subunit [Chloroflexi bacterium]|nr:xanthine dehydrogenase small subunit [Chloroflexota bacterium]